MIIIPVIKPNTLKSLETDFGSTIAAAIWKKMVEHQNYINSAIPIGMVMFFYASQTFADSNPISSPNSNWQLCDGSLITNIYSPLVGQNVPNLTAYFLKGGVSIGATGGSNSFSLAHNHGGSTGGKADVEGPPFRTDDSNEEYAGNFHTHPISMDLSTYSKLPPYAELQPYMRIA